MISALTCASPAIWASFPFPVVLPYASLTCALYKVASLCGKLITACASSQCRTGMAKGLSIVPKTAYRHSRAPPVIPAKPVPDPDRGAGTQTGSAGVPARILAPAKATQPPSCPRRRVSRRVGAFVSPSLNSTYQQGLSIVPKTAYRHCYENRVDEPGNRTPPD